MSKKNTKAPLELSINIKEIHSSWIQELPYGSLLEKLRKATTIHEPQLLNIISKHLPIYEIDLNNTMGYLYKLHNMKPKELEALVIKAGVSQFSQPIKQIINQQDVKNIKQLLGEDLYQFALNCTPSESPKTTIFKGNSEDLFNSPSPFIKAGMHTLKVVLKGHPNNCFYKLPKNWNKNYSEETTKETDLRDQRLQKILLNSLV